MTLRPGLDRMIVLPSVSAGSPDPFTFTRPGLQARRYAATLSAGEDDGRIQSSRQEQISMGLIIRQREPKNLETPFAQVDSFLTPSELFYIRSHFPTPHL